jgi:hypothetical protein
LVAIARPQATPTSRGTDSRLSGNQATPLTSAAPPAARLSDRAGGDRRRAAPGIVAAW